MPSDSTVIAPSPSVNTFDAAWMYVSFALESLSVKSPSLMSIVRLFASMSNVRLLSAVRSVFAMLVSEPPLTAAKERFPEPSV